MSKVYVAMVADRHADEEPYVFSTAAAAIEFARQTALASAYDPADVEERHIEGWLFYATYSPESDRVWVVEKEVDAS